MRNVLLLPLIFLLTECHKNLVAPSPVPVVPDPPVNPIYALPKVEVNTSYSLPKGDTINVKAGDDLQMAIDQSKPDDVIVLQAGATFIGNFILKEKSGQGWIYIISSKVTELPVSGKRIKPSDATNMPKVVAAGELPAIATQNKTHNYRLVGLEIGMVERQHSNYSLIDVGSGEEKQIAEMPVNIIVDRCYIHGNNTGNLKVGVNLNCINGAIIDSHIDNIHAESGVSHFESKAILSFNSPGPLKIENNFLEASHITILIGGAITSISGIVPSDITVVKNFMYKRPSWNPADPHFAGTIWGVKNLFEIKSGRRILLQGNTLENNWPSDPNVAGGQQSGWAILLTVRDEDKTMPWAVIEDITIANNIIRQSNAGIQLYGSEGKGAQRIKFSNNLFEKIGKNPTPDDKSGRICQGIDVKDVWFDHNTLLHNENNIVYSYGGGIVRFKFTNNIALFYDGFDGLSTISMESNVFVGGNSAGYPIKNYFPATIADVKFTDFDNGNYKLADNSPYKSGGTDGKDIGADISLLK